MATYKVLCADLLTGTIREEIPFSTFSYSHVLNAPGAFTGTMQMRHPKATRTNLDPGRTIIHVIRGSVVIWSGILWTATASVGNNQLQVNGEGWWSYFRNRLILSNYPSSNPPITADQLTIAQALVNNALAVVGSLPSGGTGITVGTGTSGVNRSYAAYGYEKRVVGTEVENLAKTDNGFDFAVDSAYSGNNIVNTLNWYYPRRGTPTAMVFDLNSNLEDLSIQLDATRQANSIYVLGAGNGDAMLVGSSALTSELASYPLLETTISQTSVTDLSTLGHMARAYILNYGTTVLSFPSTLTHTSADSQVGTFRTGDTVLVQGNLGYIQISARQRIMAWQVDVDEQGYEKVSINLVPDAAT